MWVYFNEPEHFLLSKCFINVEDALNFLIEQIKIKAPLEDQDFLIHEAIRNKEEHLRKMINALEQLKLVQFVIMKLIMIR